MKESNSIPVNYVLLEALLLTTAQLANGFGHLNVVSPVVTKSHSFFSLWSILNIIMLFFPPGTYLQFYQEAKSWIDALEHCQREYSSLAEITNQTVKDEVENLLQNKTGLREGVWVGLERSIFGKHKEWMWTSGSKNINLQWNSSMQHFNNHCAKIISAELQEIKLLDANCHDKLPYICQGKCFTDGIA
uniref:C-type lectin domain-containing protein n=1 Tax=Amphilophus citrinellus TaxID=61819 RepID=A0A3Q0RTA8_AMPCI